NIIIGDENMKFELLNDSFIISRENLLIHDNLTYIYHLSDGYLYTSHEDTIFKYEESSSSIYIIGYALDVRNGDLKIESVAKNLLTAYEDKNNFLEELDYISGRYILLLDNGDKTEIYTDATGLKPIFYWDNVIYGSHEVLVREIINANFEVQINKLSKRMNGYLDYSNSNGIFKVNPNFTYYISENKPMRIYPRKKFKLKTSEEVLNLLLPAFEEEVKWLDNQNQKLYLSLTGGFDSKVTMALTKNIQEKMSYFTY